MLNDLDKKILKSDYYENVKLLLKNKADINKPDNNGNTPLIISINQNNNAIAKLLLESKSNIEQQNNNGDTALMISIQQNNDEITNLLLNFMIDADDVQ